VKKRINLVLPQELHAEVKKVADKNNSTVLEVLKRFIKIGLLAVEVKRAGGSLIIREPDGTEKEIIIL
jgi:hypothetical protein